MWDVQLFKINYDQKERNAINNVLDSGWIAGGANINLFEKELEKILENRKTLTISNCTNSLDLALKVAKIKKNDEVIISSCTFVSDINVVIANNAKPVLADVSSRTNMNSSYSSIASLVSNKTKAIIYTQYGGSVSHEIMKIRSLCNKKSITLIEDCAHSIGADFKGRPVGSFGHISCFSFYANKNISLGEGGAISFENESDYEYAKLLRSHGVTNNILDRYQGKSLSYDCAVAGYNYRMPEIVAAIGVAQLKKLKREIAAKKNIYNFYINEFKSYNVLPAIYNPKNSNGSYHIAVFSLPKNVNRNHFCEFLKYKKIQTSLHYPPFWNFSAHNKNEYKRSCPNYVKYSDSLVTLPLYGSMKKKDIKLVVRAVKNFFEQ